jgi:cysteinyl-tRNA synthetase
MFETLLDSDTWVLGVDEHTGLIIDLDNNTGTVVGNGTVTVRLRDTSHVFPTGTVIPLSTLQNPWSALSTTGSGAQPTTSGVTSTQSAAPAVQQTGTTAQVGSLTEELHLRQAQFTEAINNRDADGAVRACLALEQAIHDWSADTLDNDESNQCRLALRSMISALGDAAVSGVRNPRDVVAPYVEAMLTVRATVRAEKRYDLSDVLRDAFVNIGIEVRDTPNGVEWNLRTDV